MANLVAYLKNNFLLSPYQYDSREGRSAEDQLLLTYGDVGQRVDSGCVVDVVLVDLLQAV